MKLKFTTISLHILVSNWWKKSNTLTFWVEVHFIKGAPKRVLLLPKGRKQQQNNKEKKMEEEVSLSEKMKQNFQRLICFLPDPKHLGIITNTSCRILTYATKRLVGAVLW